LLRCHDALQTHACTIRVRLGQPINPTRPQLLSASFLDPEAVALSGRVSIRDTQSYTTDGVACPVRGASIVAIIANANGAEYQSADGSADTSSPNEIKAAADDNGQYGLTIPTGGASVGRVVGELRVKLDGHRFAAKVAGPDGAVIILSQEEYTSYTSGSDSDPSAATIDLKLAPDRPGSEDVLVIQFRLVVGSSGTIDLDFLDITASRVLTIEAQQGLCTDTRIPLSPLDTDRNTEFSFVGGNDPESWCPNYERKWNLPSGRVRANVPLPPIPVVAFVSKASTGRQQAYFDYIGVQKFALHKPLADGQETFPSSWIFRSVPQLSVEIVSAGALLPTPGSGRNNPDICVNKLDATDPMIVLPALGSGERDSNLELKVSVHEIYERSRCEVVPGAFSLSNLMDFEDGESYQPLPDDFGSESEESDAAVSASESTCLDYVERNEFVPPSTDCTNVVVPSWPIKIKLRARRPAAAPLSADSPLRLVYPVGLTITFQAAVGDLSRTALGYSVNVPTPFVRTPRQTLEYQLRNVFVEGEYVFDGQYSTQIPKRIPMMFLYDPPGDTSYAELSKGTVIKQEWVANIGTDSGVKTDGYVKFLKADIELTACVGFGAMACVSAPGSDWEFFPQLSWDYEKKSGSGSEDTITIEKEVTETIRTSAIYAGQDTTTSTLSSGASFVYIPGNGDTDLFVSLSVNVPYTKSRLVSLDRQSCSASVSDKFKLAPNLDTENALEVETIYDIKFRILPELYALKSSADASGLSVETTSGEGSTQVEVDDAQAAQRVQAAINEWEIILRMHQDRYTVAKQSGSAKSNMWNGRFGKQLVRVLRNGQAGLKYPPYMTEDGLFNSDANRFAERYVKDLIRISFGSAKEAQGGEGQTVEAVEQDSAPQTAEGEEDRGVQPKLPDVEAESSPPKVADDPDAAYSKVDTFLNERGTGVHDTKSLQDMLKEVFENERDLSIGNAYANTQTATDASNTLSGINRVTFSGGGQAFEYTYTSSVETASQHELRADDTRFLAFKWLFEMADSGLGFSSEGQLGQQVNFAISASNMRSESHPVTVKFELSDDDLGDFYSVEILEDPWTGIPIFHTLSGQSSCPHFFNTVNREGVDVLQQNFNILDADPETPYVIFVPIVNSSPTDDIIPLAIVADPSTNQKGLELDAFGVAITQDWDLSVYITPNAVTLVEVGIERPDREEPQYFHIDKVLTYVGSPCNWIEVRKTFVVTMQYMKPCPAIEFVGSIARDWTVERESIGDSSLARTLSDDLIVPSEGLVIAVRNPRYQLGEWRDSDQLEEAVVQVRRVGTSLWVPISGNLKNDPQTSFGEVTLENIWPNDVQNPDSSDGQWPAGLYELRAITKCKSAAGTRSDHLKYHVTKPVRAVIGTSADPLTAIQEQLDDVRTEIATKHTALQQEVTGVKTDVAATRSELKTDVAATRAELKTDVAATRSELKADVASVKTDVAQVSSDIAMVQADVSSSNSTLHTQVASVKSGVADVDADVGSTRIELKAHITQARIDKQADIQGVSDDLARIVVNSSDIICGLDADVSALNDTLDSWTEGAYSLQSDSEGDRDSASDSALSSTSKRRVITCDANHALRCCGNGILEIGEVCDTLKPSAGCVDCIVADDWLCTGEVGDASICTSLQQDNTPITVIFKENARATATIGSSVSLGSGVVAFRVQFPLNMVADSEKVNVSLPTIGDTPPLPSTIRGGGTVLRVVASTTPQFTSGPIVISMTFALIDGSGCDTSVRLHSFDEQLDEWRDAASTCGSDNYRVNMDSVSCSLTTHVCHLTDFAALSTLNVSNTGSSSDSSFWDDNLTVLIIGIAGGAIVLLAVVAYAMVRRCRQQKASEQGVELQSQHSTSGELDLVGLDMDLIRATGSGATDSVLESGSKGDSDHDYDHDYGDSGVAVEMTTVTTLVDTTVPANASDRV
jgi:hypothetical protein